MSELQGDTVTCIKELVHTYFPDTRFVDETSLETEDTGEVFYEKKDILPYLQTIFFEESLVELQPAQTTRVYFAHMMDDLPDLFEDQNDNGEVIIVEPDYEAGSYLKEADSFLFTPLTPAIGNGQVRSARHIIARFFSGTIAIELGCSFREQTTVCGQPALRFNFPEVGRVNRNFRSFRVKASESLGARAVVFSSTHKEVSESLYPIYDVSAGGVSLVIPGDEPPFAVGQELDFSIRAADLNEIKVRGVVRNVNKVRAKKSYLVLCGVKIDLETRTLAADLEQLVARVQRIHLRELSEKTDDLDGVNLIRS